MVDQLAARTPRPSTSGDWLVALFDGAGNVVDVYASSPATDVRVALEVMTGAAVADPALNFSITTTLPLDGDHTVQLGVFAVPRGTQRMGDSEAIPHGANLRRIAETLLSRKHELAETMTYRRSSKIAMYVLNAGFGVESEWRADDYATTPLMRMIEPRRGRFPGFVDRLLRQMTAQWHDGSLDGGTGTARLFAGVIVETIPLKGEFESLIGVSFELLGARHVGTSPANAFRLSAREREVLALLFDGHSISEIANYLYIAESTVQDHIKRLMLKTESGNRIAMAAKILGWPEDRAQFSNGVTS